MNLLGDKLQREKTFVTSQMRSGQPRVIDSNPRGYMTIQVQNNWKGALGNALPFVSTWFVDANGGLQYVHARRQNKAPNSRAEPYWRHNELFRGENGEETNSGQENGTPLPIFSRFISVFGL